MADLWKRMEQVQAEIRQGQQDESLRRRLEEDDARLRQLAEESAKRQREEEALAWKRRAFSILDQHNIYGRLQQIQAEVWNGGRLSVTTSDESPDPSVVHIDKDILRPYRAMCLSYAEEMKVPEHKVR